MTHSFTPLSPATVCRSVLFCFALLLAGLTAQAQTTNWTGSSSSNWNTPGNWSLGTVPTATNDVVISVTAMTQPVLSTTAVAKSVHVQSGASLTVLASGILTIANSATVGLSNDAGTILNNGTIQIDGTGSTGIFSYSLSTITNAGVINIGQSTSLGRHGIFNRGVFTNTATGRIRIDRIPTIPGVSALVNSQTTATFTNAGTITVGSSTSAGQDGIQNQNIFINQASGRIYVDRTWGNGVWNTSSAQLFENAGLIVLGANAPTGISGILNDKPFTNLAGGDIQVNQPSDNGIANRGPAGILTNNGRILIAPVASPVGHGIANILSGTFVNGTGGEIIISPLSSLTASAVYNTGTFENRACAKLTIADNINNSNSFTNDGLFTVNTGQAHTNSALTNNGVIVYPQGNPIPNVTNNDLIVGPINSCTTVISPALQIGGMNSFSASTTWYTDASLITPAGTYNQATNTLTLTTPLPGNSAVLYFAATDNVNGCTRTVSVSVSTNAFPPTVTLIFNNATLSATNNNFPVITLNNGVPATFQVLGGALYELRLVIDRINGYEIRQTDANATGVFTVNRTGPYTITVTDASGCSRTVQGEIRL